MPYLIGILLEVSSPMKVVFETFGEKEGYRSKSVFSVVNGLIGKGEVSPKHDVFAMGFGAHDDSSGFDLLGSLQNFRQNYDKMIIKKDYEDIFKNIFLLLKVSDSTLQDSLSTTFMTNVPTYMIKLLSDGLKDNPKLAKKIKDKIKPSQSFLSFIFGTKNNHNNADSIVDKVKQICLNDPKVKELLLKKEMHTFNFKDALEILSYWLEGKALDDDRIRLLLKNIEPFLYGRTKLFKTLKKSHDIFMEKKYSNHEKYLFLLSTRAAHKEKVLHDQVKRMKDKMRTNDVKIISCYIAQPGCGDLKSRTLFAQVQKDWDETATALFALSSGISTLILPEAIFLARGWKIETNNDHIKLFIQVNHPDHINEVCNLVEEIESTKDALLNIIGNVSLAKYLTKSKGRTEQEGGTCYAHASAAVLHLAMKRILNRKGGYPEFEIILSDLIKRYGEEGAHTFNVLKARCPTYRLQCRSVNADEAIDVLSKGRPLVARYRLTDLEWDIFSNFYKSNPKGILTKDTLDIGERNTDPETFGHAVVLTSSNSECFRFMNSWGADFADMGFFRVKDEEVLDMDFIDVFWTESDLEDVEKSYFKDNGTSLTHLLLHSFKGLAKKNYECPSCHEESNVKEYHGSLLMVLCPKCNKEIESGTDIVKNLYLSSLLKNQ